MSKGFISLHRKLKNNPVWNDPNYLKLWIYCLFEASHKDREQLIGNEVVKLKRGQFITGRNALAEEMNRGVKPKQKLNERTWFRYLKNLEKWGMLSIKSTNKYSIVTIVNYSIYQDVFKKGDHEVDQQLSSSCPTTDQQLSTNNNVNNVNNYLSSSNIGAELIDEDWKEVIGFYRENLQVGVTEIPHNEKKLLDLYEIFGKDLVMAAMKLSAEKGKKEVAYVNGILGKWRDAGVKTIEDARKFELNFRANQKVYQFNRGDRIENNEPNYELPPQKNGHVRLYK